ncbi:hypothetical protein EBU99_08565 [bacterium]|nr:hypothetical protein [bacterium]
MKMKSLALLASMPIFFLSHQARGDGECEDIKLQFVDGLNHKNTPSVQLSRRQVTALIPCKSKNLNSSTPEITTIHFLEHIGNELCVAERTCGNVRAWHGYFAVRAGWSELTVLGDYQLLWNSLRFNRDWHGFRALATFALSGGEVERDCSPMSAASCIELPDSLQKDDLSWK